jgi:RsbT co-antagonist protein rsbRD N-terminal domain
MLNIPSERKRAVAQEWLDLTLRTYPSQSMQFLLHEKDFFRNPVGQAIKEGLALLAEELFGDMNSERVRQALEGIVRIRAVQSFSAREAVGFVFLLKGILQEELAADWASYHELDGRLDEIALAAFDLYVQCRKQISEIQVSEAKRRVALLERIYSGVEGR